MRIAGVLLAVVIAFALAAFQPASAATMRATFYGKVAYGSAPSIGLGTSDLEGLRYRMQFVYDTDLGIPNEYPGSLPDTGVATLSGAFTSASVAIGNLRFSMNTFLGSTLRQYAVGPIAPDVPSGFYESIAWGNWTDPTTGAVTQVTLSGSGSIYGGRISGTVPYDLTQPFSLRLKQSSFREADSIMAFSAPGTFGGIIFAPQRLTVQRVRSEAVVPLPASAWALLSALVCTAAFRLTRRTPKQDLGECG